MRKRISRKKSNKLFKRTAIKVHKKNLKGALARGGYRL